MHRTLIAFSLAAASLLGSASALGQVVTPARDSASTITYIDPAFTDARLRIDATQTIAVGSSGIKGVQFSAAPSLESYNLSSSGAVGVTLHAFTPPADFDLTVNAAGAGSWTITERFSTTPFDGAGPLYIYTDFNDNFVPFVNNTLPALELFLPIGGLLDTGGSFGIGFNIAGNFSTTSGLASTSGQYFLAGLDPDWAIDTNFVYDPLADVTRFHATNPNYLGDGSEHPSPFVDVYFFGSVAAVPEPGSWMMMIVGFGILGAALRRRRAGIVVPVVRPGVPLHASVRR